MAKVTGTVKDGQVGMLDDSGNPVWVPEADVSAAMQQGWQVETPSMEIARKTGAAEAEAKGGVAGMATAGLAGLARGATFGLSDIGIGAQGVGQELKDIEQANPVTSFVGQAAGMLAPVGAGAAAAQLGTKVAGKIAGEGAGLAARIASRAAAGSAEGALMGAGQTISDAALANRPLDPDQLAESALTNIGGGVLLGGSLGGGGAVANEVLGKIAGRMQQDLAKRSTRWAKYEESIQKDIEKLKASGAESIESTVKKPGVKEFVKTQKSLDDLEAELAKARIDKDRFMAKEASKFASSKAEGLIADSLKSGVIGAAYTMGLGPLSVMAGTFGTGLLASKARQLIIPTVTNVLAAGRRVARLGEEAGAIAKLANQASSGVVAAGALALNRMSDIEAKSKELDAQLAAAREFGDPEAEGSLLRAKDDVDAARDEMRREAMKKAIAHEDALNRMTEYGKVVNGSGPAINIASPQTNVDVMDMLAGASKSKGVKSGSIRSLSQEEYARLAQRAHAVETASLGNELAKYVSPVDDQQAAQRAIKRQVAIAEVMQEAFKPTEPGKPGPGKLDRLKAARILDTVLNPDSALRRWSHGQLMPAETAALQRVYGEEMESLKRKIAAVERINASRGVAWKPYQKRSIDAMMGRGISAAPGAQQAQAQEPQVGRPPKTHFESANSGLATGTQQIQTGLKSPLT